MESEENGNVLISSSTAYDSVYEFEFCFRLGHKRSTTAPNTIARENQP